MFIKGVLVAVFVFIVAFLFGEEIMAFWENTISPFFANGANGVILFFIMIVAALTFVGWAFYLNITDQPIWKSIKRTFVAMASIFYYDFFGKILIPSCKTVLDGIRGFAYLFL